VITNLKIEVNNRWTVAIN